jgi:Uma2 family endonuclease
MAAKADALLMTVERFRELPDLPGARQELHWGQVVNVAFPKAIHANLQYRLVELLRPIAEEQGMVQHELAFAPSPSSTGCEEFWLVDPHRKTVNVTQQDGDYTLYGMGDRIPLARFNAGLDVDAIFAV